MFRNLLNVIITSSMFASTNDRRQAIKAQVCHTWVAMNFWLLLVGSVGRLLTSRKSMFDFTVAMMMRCLLHQFVEHFSWSHSRERKKQKNFSFHFPFEFGCAYNFVVDLSSLIVWHCLLLQHFTMECVCVRVTWIRKTIVVKRFPLTFARTNRLLTIH